VSAFNAAVFQIRDCCKILQKILVPLFRTTTSK